MQMCFESLNRVPSLGPRPVWLTDRLLHDGTTVILERRLLVPPISKLWKRSLSRSHNINLTFIFSLVIAVPTLLMLATYVWLFASAIWRDPSHAHLITLLFNWQTQAAGILAIAAALLGATAVIYQTRESQRSEECRRLRRASALRAALPMFLDVVAEYLLGCARAYSFIRSSSPGPVIRSSPGSFPVLDDSIISYVVEYIETLGQDEGRSLIVFLRELQKHRARIRDTDRRASSLAGSLLLAQNLVSRIVDTAELYARCDELFIYARVDNSLATAITADSVRKTLRQLIEDDAEREDLNSEVEFRVQAAAAAGGIWPVA